MYFKHKSASNNLDIANWFLERFLEVFAPTVCSPPPTFNQVLAFESFCDFVFVQADVFRHIQKIDNTFSASTDDIPASLVKQCAQALCHHLEFYSENSWLAV